MTIVSIKVAFFHESGKRGLFGETLMILADTIKDGQAHHKYCICNVSRYLVCRLNCNTCTYSKYFAPLTNNEFLIVLNDVNYN